MGEGVDIIQAPSEEEKKTCSFSLHYSLAISVVLFDKNRHGPQVVIGRKEFAYDWCFVLRLASDKN